MAETRSPHLHRFLTALGPCALRWGERGISAVLTPGRRELAPPVTSGPRPRRDVETAAEGIVSLLAGERTDLRFVSLDWGSTPAFDRAVYEAAREIPPGAVCSYGELAAATGAPGAAREVGAALARNPFPIVVPCHRVLSAAGTLHGFSAPGGLDTKRRMLEIERAPGFEQQPLFA